MDKRLQLLHRVAGWKLLAVAGQAAVAGAFVAVGWQVMHPHPAVAPAIQAAAPTPSTVTAGLPLPLLPTPLLGPGVAGNPGIGELVRRVNRDDAGLYRAQLQTLTLVGTATRQYLERHILPLLLAAARGGTH